MTKTKVIGTPNLECLQEVINQIAFEIYVLQAENENVEGEKLYEAV